MLRLLAILLLSLASANAAIPIIFLRAGTNAVVVPPDPTNEVGGFTTNMFVDAEDYNYSQGLYFPTIGGNAFNATSLYFDEEGATEGTDFTSWDLGTDAGYGRNDGFWMDEHDDNHEPNGVPYTDFKIRAFTSAGPDWTAYTRFFSNMTFWVYARVSSTVAFGLQLERIEDGSWVVSEGSQDRIKIGTANPTGLGTNTFFYTPFKTNGVPMAVSLVGTQALVVTITNGICDFHRLMLVTWTGNPMGFANPEEDPDVIFIDENGVVFHDPEI